MLHYDPFYGLETPEADMKRFSSRKRPPIPEAHTIGFNFDIAPDGWVDTVNFDDRGENDQGCNYEGQPSNYGRWDINDDVTEESEN